MMTSAGAVFRGTGMLRLLAVAPLGLGVWSFGIHGASTKLMFGYSLDFWDFTSAVAPFFCTLDSRDRRRAVLSHDAMACLKAAARTRIFATKDDT